MQLRTLARRPFVPRNLAATAILALTVGGVAYAAIGSSQIANNSIQSIDVKNNSLLGADIRNGTLTSADIKDRGILNRDLANDTVKGGKIDESTLGTVPTAANADKLDDMDSTEFVPTRQLVHVLKTMSTGDADVTLVSNGTVSVKMSCKNGGGNDTMNVYAATTVDGALMESDENSPDPLNIATLYTASEIADQLQGAENATASDSGYDDTGWVVDSTGSHIITLLEGSSVQILNKGGKDCIYGGTFIVDTVA